MAANSAKSEEIRDDPPFWYRSGKISYDHEPGIWRKEILLEIVEEAWYRINQVSTFSCLIRFLGSWTSLGNKQHLEEKRSVHEVRRPEEKGQEKVGRWPREGQEKHWSG
ncbi:hypothetical protein H6P81_007466 [Aristolochia fimbriata]|uniref:Uncharacterized protein n=1 Tax=Aristolochia fimbriata TaxID=158543 RepID=A0AAV7F443_ARIFI|nr:hypothetical protein H6P81_007466 [Aristolochia fimbriata]